MIIYLFLFETCIVFTNLEKENPLGNSSNKLKIIKILPAGYLFIRNWKK